MASQWIFDPSSRQYFYIDNNGRRHFQDEPQSEHRFSRPPLRNVSAAGNAPDPGASRSERSRMSPSIGSPPYSAPTQSQCYASGSPTSYGQRQPAGLPINLNPQISPDPALPQSMQRMSIQSGNRHAQPINTQRRSMPQVTGLVGDGVASSTEHGHKLSDAIPATSLGKARAGDKVGPDLINSEIDRCPMQLDRILKAYDDEEGNILSGNSLSRRAWANCRNDILEICWLWETIPRKSFHTTLEQDLAQGIAYKTIKALNGHLEEVQSVLYKARKPLEEDYINNDYQSIESSDTHGFTEIALRLQCILKLGEDLSAAFELYRESAALNTSLGESLVASETEPRHLLNAITLHLQANHSGMDAAQVQSVLRLSQRTASTSSYLCPLCEISVQISDLDSFSSTNDAGTTNLLSRQTASPPVSRVPQYSAQASPPAETHGRMGAAQDVQQIFAGQNRRYHTRGIDLRSAIQAMEGSGNRQIVPLNATLTDPESGLQTQWEVSDVIEYREPGNEDAGRSLNLKRVRQTGSRSTVPSNASRIPEDDFQIGRVIEVFLVPPEDVGLVTTITPTEDSPLERNRIRMRRFVIIRQVPPRKFEALPIKTYHGRGVSAPGVIKSHHGIIHTHGAKPPLPEEAPRRGRSGHMEAGMQAIAIKVISADAARALDPLSRLDYADRYEFDWDVANIRIFGRVHSDSLATLFLQYNVVWSSIRTVIQGASKESFPSHAQSSRTSSGLIIPEPIDYTQSGTRATVRSGRVSDTMRAPQLLRQFASANSGPCTAEQMSTIIQFLEAYAAKKQLQPPIVTTQQMHELARDPARRANYIGLIRDTLGQARLARGPESSEEESEDEESDDDG